MRILFLLLLPFILFGQPTNKERLLNRNLQVGVKYRPTYPNGTLVSLRTPVPGNAFVIIYEPPYVDVPPAGGWPVLFYYAGDGADNGATTDVVGRISFKW